MKKSRLTFLLICAVCAFSGCTKSNNKGHGNGSGSSSSAPKDDPRNVIYEDVYKDYNEHYSGYDFQELRGDDLLLEMHKYFIQEHKTYVTYENYWYYANSGTDRLPDTEQNELFYTGKTVPLRTHNGQDREHVWACAKSNGLWRRPTGQGELPVEHNIDKGTYWGGGSDLFHIRPATSSVNSNRSDASFYDFTDAELAQQKKLSDGGPYAAYVDANKNKVEVPDEFKGDVARILMYVYVHYCSRGDINVYYSKDHTPVYSMEEAITETGHSPYVCGTINLTNIMAYDTDLECARKLVEWNQIDPPSAVEVNRNNYVESIQGNRNPFIDYPQLVRKILYY